MLHRLLLSGLVVIGVAATAIVNAAAQPFTGTAAAGAIRDAYALAARIRGYHRWTGLTPPPGSYCATMREGEAVLKELARLASRAILYRQSGLALRLQRAGDGLSDELDDEEEINQQAKIPYLNLQKRRGLLGLPVDLFGIKPSHVRDWDPGSHQLDLELAYLVLSQPAIARCLHLLRPVRCRLACAATV
jgi:hypothetical protein